MNTLYLFVEGTYDERFFRNHYKGNSIKIVTTANRSTKDINNLLRTLNITNCAYLFIVDSDGASPEEKRKKTLQKYPQCKESQIVVVCFEIESWYLAGLNQNDSQKLGVKFISLTDDVTKEQFLNLKPKKMSTLDFMLEILRLFDPDSASQRNTSYRLFLENQYA